jgi:hypothetical protein
MGKTKTTWLAAALLAAAVAGCATPQPWRPTTPKGTRVPCGELGGGFPGLIPDPVTPDRWEPEANLEPGFLLIKYRTDGTQTYAVGFHFANDTVAVPFIVGPMKDVPPQWRDDLEQAASPAVSEDWFQFFSRVRRLRYLKPGGLVCRNRTDCGRTPDVPPPELVGSASSSSSGGLGMLVDSDVRYAQVHRPSDMATDAILQASPERERIIRDIAQNLCQGAQLLSK